MTDEEQTTEQVSKQPTEKVAKKTRKKAVKKVAQPAAETVSEQVAESASEPGSKEDKRVRLANKLKAMGMMPGAKAAAASDSVMAAASRLPALPAWLSPQLLALTAGAGVFTLLIWSLQQEKQHLPQQAATPVAPVYSPYAMPYPTPPVRPIQNNTASAATAPVTPEPSGYPVPPAGYSPYMAPPVTPYPEQAAQAQTENKTAQAQPPQPTGQAAYPPPAYYQGTYSYGYHPAMRFGFNGNMRGRGAPSYYRYAPPPPAAYAYPPYGRVQGYGNPPLQEGQR